MGHLIAEHEAVWESFWSASGIEISDEFLQNVFYRSLYFLRCVSKPGVQAAGLFAGLINSTPAWHGDYHSNYNSWQTFWPAYVCNHVELAEPFERLVSEYLPRGRWFARQTYDCGGVCFPISLFAYEPAPGNLRSVNQRTLNLFPWSYTIGQAGWMVQNLWLHYQYQPDRAYLERIAYSAVRDAAVFYADFMDKCRTDAKGRVILGPSYSPEHRGFGIDNCPCDIAYARFSFEAAIAAAGILGQDAELVARFKQQLDRLPEYPVTPEPEPMVTDVEGGAPLNYNIAVPVLPVFPAGLVTVFSGEEERALFRRTLERVQWTGYNSRIIMPVARAAELPRLGGVHAGRVPETLPPQRHDHAASRRPLRPFYRTVRRRRRDCGAAAAKRRRHHPCVSGLAPGAGREVRKPPRPRRLSGQRRTEGGQSDKAANRLDRRRQTAAARSVDRQAHRATNKSG